MAAARRATGFALDVATQRAVLVIADISGFTSFMRLNALATSHAKQIVVRLLTALVRRHRAPLQVAELEGDAVFLWGALDADPTAATRAINDQLLDFFGTFRAEIDALRSMPLCVCGACTNVSDLRLKQVVHVGDVAPAEIGGFTKLFGIDVILVHRMLKTSVASHEYVLMTDAAHAALGAPASAAGTAVEEELEGVGRVAMQLYEAHRLEPFPAPPTDEVPGFKERLRWKLGMHARTVGGLFRRD